MSWLFPEELISVLLPLNEKLCILFLNCLFKSLEKQDNPDKKITMIFWLKLNELILSLKNKRTNDLIDEVLTSNACLEKSSLFSSLLETCMK